MPKYTPSDEDMEEAYGPPTKPSAAPAKAPPSVDEENAKNAELVISKDELPGKCKVGDTYTFRVVKDYGDEAALELVEESEPETPEEPMATAGRELAAMSEENA